MSKKARAWTLRILSIVIGIGLLAALIHLAGARRLFLIFRQASPAWLAAAFGIYACSWIFRTWRLKLFTSLRALDAFKLHISGHAINALMPTKLGDAALVGYLKMYGIPLGRSLAVVVQIRVLDAVAVALLSLSALILFAGGGSPTPAWMVTSIAVCAAFAAIPVGLVILDRGQKFPGALARMEERRKNRAARLVLQKIKEACAAYYQIVSDRRLLAPSVLFSLLLWLGDGLCACAVAAALGSNMPAAAIILAVMIGNVSKSAPSTPGSFGVYEGVFAAVLVLSGAPFETALAIGILDHLVKKLFNLSLGLPATARIGMGLDKIRGLAEEWKKETA
jgi:uncharacterized protein (TIRG00374 family)